MDQMLPSPGFSIPSVGTPLHQPEEDQQILPNALQQQQNQPYQLQQMHTMSPGMQGSSGMMMLATPQKSMHTYAPMPTFATPQSLMQPQTPVNCLKQFLIQLICLQMFRNSRYCFCSKTWCRLWYSPTVKQHHLQLAQQLLAQWHQWHQLLQIQESFLSFSN